MNWKIYLFLALFTSSGQANSAAQWYLGKISRIWPHTQDGGFIITFSSPSSLSDCKHSYAYFRSETLQPEKLKNSMSIALSAFHSGSTVGVIINKGDPGEICYASDIDLRR